MNNHKEIMEALLQGKKIRNVNWSSNEYTFLDDTGKLETASKRPYKYLDLCVDYEEYIEYVDFNVAMKHIANGGKAKRKNWNYAIFCNSNGMVIFDDASETPYELKKQDIEAEDWILL